MTIRCSELDNLLSDGDPASLALAAEHARNCDACMETLTVWNEISATAASMQTTWDSDLLWPRIERGLQCHLHPAPRDLRGRELRIDERRARLAFAHARHVLRDALLVAGREERHERLVEDIARLARHELRERLVRQFDFTYGDLLIQAVARALLRHPRMNARLAEDAIVIMPQVNVGMAVALEDGLIVPVIAEADRKSLREIAAATRELGERARAGKLRLEEVSGGTFTITNLGTYGVDAFTPIINPGETGILGVGRIIEKPVIHRGEIARRSMMTLSLTFDHRLIDGAPAAQFLQTVIEIFNFGER